MKKYIYFDNAATTPVAEEVLEAMLPYFREKYGNASSLHSLGLSSDKAVEKARQQTADFLNCLTEEVIFTSGATESNNLTVLGLAKSLGQGHIITTAIEHPAILEPCEALEKEGYELTKLPVSSKGIISLKTLKEAIQPDTFLITIMYVNNEIGAIQPIKEIGQLIKEVNKNRKQKIYFHTDAVQAASFFPCDVDVLGLDFISISGHKIYGPKGVGALYVRKGSPLKSIQYGGHHERSLRPGTINTPLIVGLGKALEIVKKRRVKDTEKVNQLSKKIINYILKNIPMASYNGDENLRAPGHVNITFENIEGESLLLLLDAERIAVSTGSACASHSLIPSHVLKAIGLSNEKCHGTIRLSLGRDNTEEEVEVLLKVLPKIIKKIRERSPLK